MVNTQEAAVIAEVLDGNSETYSQLIERYHRGLIQHLYNLVHDGDLAEDLAQEAFIRAYQKLNQYNPDYAFSTWLYKIADNIAYSHFKQVKLSEDIDDYEDSLPDNRPSLDEVADRTIRKEAVRTAIATLPTAYQRVITLYYWDNFSYEEIAQIMDRPVGTVRTWIHRAKEQLRKELYGQV